MHHPNAPADDEARRLAALHELAVLDTDAEPEFDALVRAASLACDVPIALISLVDADRQWFKANIGLPQVAQTGRDIAFCDHTLRHRHGLQVEDARLDARFAANPLVTGEPGIRAYAGAPLELPGGERVGTLCVIDRQPREFDAAQRELLRCLAVATVRALQNRRERLQLRAEVRRGEAQARRAEQDLRRLRTLLEGTDAGTWKWNLRSGEFIVNAAWCQIIGRDPAELRPMSIAAWHAGRHPDDRAAGAAALQRHLDGEEPRFRFESRVRHADGHWVWVIDRARVLAHADDGRPEWLLGTRRDITARKQAEDARRQSEAFLERTGRLAGIGGWEYDIASEDLRWSAETRRLHGVDADYRPRLESAIAFYEPAARPRLLSAVLAAINDGVPWDLTLPLVRADGRRIWARAVGAAEPARGRAVRLLGAVQDVTAEVESRQELLRQTLTLSSVTEAIPALVAVIDRDGRYRFANRAFRQAYPGPVIGRPVREVLGEAEFARRQGWIERAQAGEGSTFTLDHGGPDGLRHTEISYVPLRLDDREADGFVVITQDVTARKREELRLTTLSQRDALTGVLNRAGFEAHLARVMAGVDAGMLALLYIDLDHFKPVNDRHGHAAGDRVLQGFAQRLARLVRPQDAVARLGGDEFAVALTETRELSQAQAVAERVIAAAAAPFEFDGLEVRIGASVGIAGPAGPGSDWQALIEQADHQLLQAKAAGKGRLARAA